jgi:predicted enzyme related to lactoylglutathione lyase
MPTSRRTSAVDDRDAAAANVAELGGAVTVPLTDIPVGRLSVLNDPQGVVFSIIRMNQFDLGP